MKRGLWLLRGLGAVCFAAVIALWIIGKISWTGTGHTVVLMGDSVMANKFNGALIEDVLSEKLGVEVQNAAFGGSSVVYYNPYHYETLGGEVFCLEPLVNAIILQDFSVQEAALERGGPLEYFPERLAQLEETDFSLVDCLVLGYGANDYANQVPPEEVEAVLTSCVQKLTECFPDLDIYISSPGYNYLYRDGEKIFCDSGEWGDYLLEEYVDRERAVAEAFGLTFIDNYHDSLICRETIDLYTVDGEGLHLNEAGREILSDSIARAILGS